MIEDILDKGMKGGYKANSTHSRYETFGNAFKYLGYLSLAVFLSSCANDYGNHININPDITTMDVKDRKSTAKKILKKKLIEISGKTYNIEYDVNKNFAYDGEVLKKEDIKKDFQYDDDVSLLARHFVNLGYFRNPEEFILTLRLGYFEGAFDSKAKDFDDLKKGLDGIYHVAKRRMDNQRTRGNESINLFDILFNYNYNENNKKVYEFTCVGREERFFRTNLADKSLNMFSDNRLNMAVGGMGKDRTMLTFESLYDVLTGKVSDPTRGATYYKNPEKCDSRNTDILWLLKGRVPVTRINSHVFWKELNLATDVEIANYIQYMEKRRIEPEKVLIASTPNKNTKVPYDGRVLSISNTSMAYVVENKSIKSILIKPSRTKKIYKPSRPDSIPVYYAKTPKKIIKEKYFSPPTPLYAVVGKKKP